MKGIIIYKSKYGAARKYAGWLNEATGYEAVSVEKTDVNTLSDYDVIILGGGVYAHGIAIVPFLKKNLCRLKGKKIIVYTCGASPYDEKFFNELVDMNMKGELKGIPVYYCRGGFDLKGMTFMDRTLCKMLLYHVGTECIQTGREIVWLSAILCTDHYHTVLLLHRFTLHTHRSGRGFFRFIYPSVIS